MYKVKRQYMIDRNTTHGMYYAPDGKRARLNYIWARMRQRCRDKNCSDYSRYGGVGIDVCLEWHDYLTFHKWAIANGYKSNLTLDRKDSKSGYNPLNCHWIPMEQQARNRKNNRHITYNGETKLLCEWCILMNVGHSFLRYRIKKWGVKRALETPIIKGRRKSEVIKVKSS